jgi:hypothetical protein
MSVPATADPQAPPQGTDAPNTGPAGAIPAGEQRADPTQVSSAETQEQTTRPPDYVREAFARLRGYTQTAASTSEPQTNGNATQTAPQAPPASSGPAQEPGGSDTSVSKPASTFPAAPRDTRSPSPARPEQITLSPQELQRQIQAEADRILAKRMRDEQARTEREREVELRQNNPFAYARLMEEKETQLAAAQEETQRLTGVVSTQLQFYDRAVLDTFVSALPPEERMKVIGQEQDAVENRKSTAQNTLKALRQRWVAEGRASAKADLMKDQTFIKEILARYGQATPEPEPVQVSVRSASDAAQQSGNDGMNAFIRNAALGVRSS